MNINLNPLEIGKGRIIKEGNTLAIINFGARLNSCLEALDLLKVKGHLATIKSLCNKIRR